MCIIDELNFLFRHTVMPVQYECLLCGFKNGYSSVWNHVARVHVNQSYVPWACQCGMVFKRQAEAVKHLNRSGCTMVTNGVKSKETPFNRMMIKITKRPADLELSLPQLPGKRPALNLSLFEDISDCELDYNDDLPGTPLMDETPY